MRGSNRGKKRRQVIGVDHLSKSYTQDVLECGHRLMTDYAYYRDGTRYIASSCTFRYCAVCGREERDGSVRTTS